PRALALAGITPQVQRRALAGVGRRIRLQLRVVAISQAVVILLAVLGPGRRTLLEIAGAGIARGVTLVARVVAFLATPVLRRTAVERVAGPEADGPGKRGHRQRTSTHAKSFHGCPLPEEE